jgi:aminoglycoside phosphotransferase
MRVSAAEAREASEALLLASTSARILEGMSREDPEMQLHRMQAFEAIAQASRVLHRLYVPIGDAA